MARAPRARPDRGRRRSIVSGAAALVLCGLPLLTCSRQQEPAPARQGKESPVQAKAAPATYRGLLVLREGGALSFQKCGESSLSGLIDRTNGAIGTALHELGGPDAPVFVVVRGVLAESGGKGAAVSVTSLIRAAPVGERSGCEDPPAAYRFRAIGEEPFWNVTVAEDSIVFAQPGVPARIAFPAAPAERVPGAIRYRTETMHPRRHRLELTLTEGRCADSMSGALYSFSARVVLDGVTLSGCAREGDLWEDRNESR